jgi:hypothetical protein
MMATRHWMSARRPQPRLQRSAMHEKETKMIRLYEEANNMIATNGKTTNNYIVVDGTPQQEFSITRTSPGPKCSMVFVWFNSQDLGRVCSTV